MDLHRVGNSIATALTCLTPWVEPPTVSPKEQLGRTTGLSINQVGGDTIGSRASVDAGIGLRGGREGEGGLDSSSLDHFNNVYILAGQQGSGGSSSIS